MNHDELKQKDRLTYAEAAAYCGRSVRTMKRWVNRGMLQAGRFTLGSVFIVRESIDKVWADLVAAESGRTSDAGPVTAKNLCPSRS